MISQAEAEHLRMEEESQMEAVVQQRAGVEQVHLESEAQIRRFDEERAEIEAGYRARQAEAERQLIEAGRQLIETEKISRAEQEQLRRRTDAWLEPEISQRTDTDQTLLEKTRQKRKSAAVS